MCDNRAASCASAGKSMQRCGQSAQSDVREGILEWQTLQYKIAVAIARHNSCAIEAASPKAE
jgi:hypothetical protein